MVAEEELLKMLRSFKLQKLSLALKEIQRGRQLTPEMALASSQITLIVRVKLGSIAALRNSHTNAMNN